MCRLLISPSWIASPCTTSGATRSSARTWPSTSISAGAPPPVLAATNKRYNHGPSGAYMACCAHLACNQQLANSWHHAVLVPVCPASWCGIRGNDTPLSWRHPDSYHGRWPPSSLSLPQAHADTAGTPVPAAAMTQTSPIRAPMSNMMLKPLTDRVLPTSSYNNKLS